MTLICRNILRLLKVICFFLLLTINVQANCNLKGDINDDCKIDVKEAIHALQVASGLIPAPVKTISEHLLGLAIDKGRDYNWPNSPYDDEYEFWIGLLTDNTVQSVSILCPGGKIIEINEYEPEDRGKIWKFEQVADNSEELEQYGDGEFVIKLQYFSGYNETTIINYYDIESSKTFSFFQKVPAFLFPLHDALLDPDEPVVFNWDKNNIDASVKKIEIECENEDEEIEKVYDVSKNPPSDPFYLSKGDWECDIKFEKYITGKNLDNVNYEIGVYSESDYVIHIVQQDYQWTDYDNFDDNSLDYSKWAIDNEATNTIPQEKNGQIEFNTEFTGDGSSYLEIKESGVWGVKTDITLNSSSHNNAGIEIYVDFSDPNIDEAYFHIFLFNNNVGLGAELDGNDDSHSWEIYPPGFTNILNTKYNFAFVFEDDTMKCFLNNNLIGESQNIANLSSSIESIGIGTWTNWPDHGGTVVGKIDNVQILK